MPDDDLQLLQAMIASYLDDHPGCSEHDLINWLRSPEQGFFNADALSDSLLLFRTHFLVMHCLYRLRNQWLESNTCWLEISPLSITKQPLVTGTDNQALAETDALAAYYLNLDELATSRDAVDALLQDFWERLLLPRDRMEDLAVLGLDNNASADIVRLTYRRLANEHHPDKGGDAERFRQINAAYQRLKRRA